MHRGPGLLAPLLRCTIGRLLVQRVQAVPDLPNGWRCFIGHPQLEGSSGGIRKGAGIAGVVGSTGAVQHQIQLLDGVFASEHRGAVRGAQGVEHVPAAGVHVGVDVPLLAVVVQEAPDVVDPLVGVALEEAVHR